MKMYRLPSLPTLLTLALVAGGVALLLAPAHAQTAAAKPTRFTVTDSGTVGKPDIILIPGLSSSAAVWDAEAKLLAPTYRLHVLQVGGFAGAPVAGNASGAMLPGIVDELHAYIVATKMHPVVIGHSMGGLMALMLADKHPEDASKLVIVDSLPFYTVLFSPDATAESARPMAEAMKAQIIAAPQAQYDAMAKASSAPMVKNVEAQKLVASSAIATDRAVMAEAVLEDMTTDLRAKVAAIKTPTLMLYPWDASVAPDAAKIDVVYQTAYKPMPNVKLMRIDDSRHFIMYDQPAQMDAAIQAFLK